MLLQRNAPSKDKRLQATTSIPEFRNYSLAPKLRFLRASEHFPITLDVVNTLEA